MIRYHRVMGHDGEVLVSSRRRPRGFIRPEVYVREVRTYRPDYAGLSWAPMGGFRVISLGGRVGRWCKNREEAVQAILSVPPDAEFKGQVISNARPRQAPKPTKGLFKAAIDDLIKLWKEL